MSHACPGGCGRHVTSDRYACLRDWYRLPAPTTTSGGTG